MAKILVVLLKLYKWGISPMLPPVCRYHPCCSSYAIESLTKYGCLKGGTLALRRLSRCHPFGKCGYDPVP